MADILNQIEKVRQKLKTPTIDILLAQKPFVRGMYRFSMFMLSYYSRVSRNLKLDYDSFMVVQTVVSHNLYYLKRRTDISGYGDLEDVWTRNEKSLSKLDIAEEFIYSRPSDEIDKSNKLTISSICFVTGLPKETARRKVINLSKKNILKISKKKGVELGNQYKKIFQGFVPETTLEVSKMVKDWEKSGVLKSLLKF
jgi:hypothetical protein